MPPKNGIFDTSFKPSTPSKNKKDIPPPSGYANCSLNLACQYFYNLLIFSNFEQYKTHVSP